MFILRAAHGESDFIGVARRCGSSIRKIQRRKSIKRRIAREIALLDLIYSAAHFIYTYIKNDISVVYIIMYKERALFYSAKVL